MEKAPVPDFAEKMAALKLSKKKLPVGKVAQPAVEKAPASKASGATAYCVKCKTQKGCARNKTGFIYF